MIAIKKIKSIKKTSGLNKKSSKPKIKKGNAMKKTTTNARAVVNGKKNKNIEEEIQQPSPTTTTTTTPTPSAAAAAAAEIPFNREKSIRFSLYIRFPKKINVNREQAKNEIKLLNKRIKTVRIPRQKSAKHCLLDFANETEKLQAWKELQRLTLNEAKPKEQLIIKDSIVDNAERLEDKIVKRNRLRISKLLLKNVCDLFLKNAKKPFRPQTNEIVIHSIPDQIEVLNGIKQLFPNAIDMKFIDDEKLNKNKNSAATVDHIKKKNLYIILPMAEDAQRIVKKKWITGLADTADDGSHTNKYRVDFPEGFKKGSMIGPVIKRKHRVDKKILERKLQKKLMKQKNA